MTGNPDFVSLGRQKFRRYFQPSRIVLGVIPAPTATGVNVITLCFDMHSSYKPPTMAIAIRNTATSYELVKKAGEYVLAVPGESLATETLFCGVNSMRDVDKVQHLGLALSQSQSISVPGLRRAIANIELVKLTCVEVGDHLVAIGRVVRFGVRANCSELPLLSIGPDTRGYRLLAQKGVHRIAVVDADGAWADATSKRIRNPR